MTSAWERLGIEDKVTNILRSVPRAGSPDAYGHPFISVYQLAIEMDAQYPEVRQELNMPLGGVDSGQPTSLTQYLAQQLAYQIKRNRAGYSIEGAGLSPMHLADVTFRTADSGTIRSSNTEARWDLSMFRLRET